MNFRQKFFSGTFKSRKALCIFTGVTALGLTSNYLSQSENTPQNTTGIYDFQKSVILRSFFGRTRSRLVGCVMEIPIPVFFRPILYNFFARMLGIDLSECRYPAYSYSSLANIFSRTLKENARHISEAGNPNVLVVPCDGKVTSLGEINANAQSLLQVNTGHNGSNCRIGPIKGATFQLDAFLGFNPFSEQGSKKSLSYQRSNQDEFQEAERKTHGVASNVPMRLFYVVIYLAPHNYHHFHSPCEFGVLMRYHMAGFVFPVFKGLAKRLNNLFAANERIVYSGKWMHGSMFFSAVGAYSVSNIHLKCEPNFKSNIFNMNLYAKTGHLDMLSYANPPSGNYLIQPSFGERREISHIKAHWFRKGERIGEFRLGSTVVLIFEAPKNFEWACRVGEIVCMGAPLGRIAHAVVNA